MKNLSSRKSILTILGGAYLCIVILALTSCNNFFHGAQEVKDEIAAAIAYNNAPKMTVQVTIGNSDYGIVYPTSFTGAVGDVFELTFAKKQNVSFKFWSCKNSNGEESDAIIFSDEKVKEDKENETTNYTVKVTIKSIEQNLTVSPKCYLTGETTPPTLTSATIKAQDSSGNYTRELTRKDFAQWSKTEEGVYKVGDFSKNRINKSLLITVNGHDEQSGLSDIKLKVSYFKDQQGNSISSTPTTSLVSIDDNICQKNDDGSYSVPHSFEAVPDGIIKIEVSIIDSCGNESDNPEVYYVLKDSGIDNVFQYVSSGSQGRQGTYFDTDIIQKAVNGKTTISFTITANQLSKTIYPDFVVSYDVSVFWGYSENEMQPLQPETTNAGDKKYSFERDSKKIVYLKCIAKDDIGNSLVVNRAWPPEMDFNMRGVKFSDGESNNWKHVNVSVIPYNYSKYKQLCRQIGADDFEIQYYLMEPTSQMAPEVQCEEINYFSKWYYGNPCGSGGSCYGTVKMYIVAAFVFAGNKYFYSPVSTTYLQFEIPSNFDGTYVSLGERKIMPETNGQSGEDTYIKDNCRLTTTSVTNSGFCKIKMEDYKSSAANGTNVKYTFICYDPSTVTFYNFTEPEFLLPSPGLYQIRIRTDDEDGYYYTKMINFYVNNSSELKDILVLEDDVTPPQIPQNDFRWYKSTPWAVTPYRYQASHANDDRYKNTKPDVNYFTPDDENIYAKSKDLGEITYYFLPNPNALTYSGFYATYTEDELAAYSAKTVTYDLNQLSYTIPQMMARSDTNALGYSEAGIHDSFHQMTIDIPYDGLDEGLYTLCIKAKDKSGNYTYAFTQVFNRLLGTRLDWTYNKADNTIQFNGGSYSAATSYYYDKDTKRWVRFYTGVDKNAGYMAYDLDYTYQYILTYGYPINDNQNWFKNRWMRIVPFCTGDSSGSTIFNSGFYDVEYIYVDYERYKGTSQAITCKSKNIIEGGINGLQVFADAPVLVHTLYCSKKLTDGTTKEDATVWLNKAMDTGVVEETGSFTYTTDNLNGVPAGYWYTTIVHFADRDVLMTEVRQK